MTPAEVIAALDAIHAFDGDGLAEELSARIAGSIGAERAKAIRTVGKAGKYRAGTDPGATAWRTLAAALGERPMHDAPTTSSVAA